MKRMTLAELETSLFLGGWKVDVRGEGETFWLNPETGAYIRVGPAYLIDIHSKRVGTYTYTINAEPMNIYSYESFYWHAFGAIWDTSDPKPWTVHLG